MHACIIIALWPVRKLVQAGWVESGVLHIIPFVHAGAYLPVLLSSRDKLQGGSGRSVAYILGNMLSAGGMWESTCTFQGIGAAHWVLGGATV